MVKSGSRGTTALRALEPGHSERIEGVKVTEDRLGALAAEDDNTGASEDSRVAVAGRWGSTGDTGLDPAG